MPLTLSQAKASIIPKSVGLCPDDPRFLLWLNSAQERLLKKGLWQFTTQHYSVCVTSGCLTWPRQFAAIESIWLCGQPLTLRGQWFEYLGSGLGLQGGCADGSCNDIPNWNGWNYLCGGRSVLFRDNACTFTDISGTNKKIKVYCDVDEEADSKILLQGYDENRNWIRTQVSGEWIDGEYVLLDKNTPQTTTNFFSSLIAVQKPLTNGNVRLYELNTDDSVQTPIAIHEPDELLPSYRRSYIPGVCTRETDDDTCHSKPVGVIAKLAFIPVRLDTDYLVIQDLTALQFMVMCVNKELNAVNSSDVQEAQAFEAKAIGELNSQLKHFRGQSVVQPIRYQPRSVGGAGVLNLV